MCAHLEVVCPQTRVAKTSFCVITGGRKTRGEGYVWHTWLGQLHDTYPTRAPDTPRMMVLTKGIPVRNRDEH